MPCELPFFPNANNYVDDGEHDKNSRKYWYLVLREGLFTLKSDADALSAPDDILILFTKAQAQRLWDMHCHKHHKHKQDDRAPEYSSDEAAALKSPPSARSSSHTRRPARSPSVTASAPTAKGKKSAFKSGTKAPAPQHAPAKPSAAVSNRKPTSIGAKREASVPVKRERDVVAQRAVKRDGDVTIMRGTSAPVKVEARTPCKLPLYLDGSDDSLEDDAGLVAERVELAEARVDVPLLLYIDDSPPPSRKRASPSTPTAGSKRARGCPVRSPSPSPRSYSLSPSLSSVSSISTDLSSASTAARGTRIPLSSASAPRRLHRAAAEQLAAAVSKGGGSGFGSASACLLYNSVTRTIYKDVNKAVEEMSLRDSVQVVECADLVDFCAGKSGKVSGKRSG
ncbi:hypothetical protein DFH09DRAFT_1332361 [Mycena vulgaris]|nr:hypothetical protein DFH09DRAFT_1332361 [Mycena vulgaris]